MAKAEKAGKQRKPRKRLVLILIVVTFHTVGFFSSLIALEQTRTAQGTVAWVVALNTMPYVAVPAYWVFGKGEFQGHVTARKTEDKKVEPTLERLREELVEREILAAPDNPRNRLIEDLTALPVTIGNHAQLLIDGDQTYDSIFDGIRNAEDYVLVQYYTIVADETGNELKAILMERALAGVRCYVIWDGVGTDLPSSYLDELTEAGVQIVPFATITGPGEKFQVNFRNHRKIVVVDGREAWVGGLNIADAYRGKDEEIGYWRDTHMKVTGPVVQSIQLTFVEDWNWAADEILEDLQWQPELADENGYAIGSISSGPSDWVEILSLFTLHLINSAEERIWIATPYFVPDIKFLRALELAAIRGVEVKILIPSQPDAGLGKLAALATWNYVEPLETVGAEIHQYTEGFMHQKVMLVDDDIATVGTANFDDRSFRLNFESTLAILGEDFAGKVETMLNEDFSKEKTRLMTSEQLEEKGYWFNIAVRAAYLTAPVL